MKKPKDVTVAATKRSGKNKNFRLDESFVEAMAAWCKRHGHTETLIIQVAFHALATKSPTERQAALDRFAEWEAEGHPKAQLGTMEAKQ